jgi:putative membrane protein
MSIQKTILFLAFTGVSTASLAAEAEKTPPTPSVFVKKASLDGMAEVEAGKLALSKSQDPAIRGFAERMVSDHGRANAELASLAKSKGIATPKGLDAEHNAMVSGLKAKSGGDFDHAYAEHMQMDHSKAISLFESAAGSSDRDFAQFAEKTLPTLKEHKQLAEKLPGKSAPGG